MRLLCYFRFHQPDVFAEYTSECIERPKRGPCQSSSYEYGWHYDNAISLLAEAVFILLGRAIPS